MLLFAHQDTTNLHSQEIIPVLTSNDTFLKNIRTSSRCSRYIYSSTRDVTGRQVTSIVERSGGKAIIKLALNSVVFTKTHNYTYHMQPFIFHQTDLSNLRLGLLVLFMSLYF